MKIPIGDTVANFPLSPKPSNRNPLIIEPKGGVRDNSYYIIEVAFNSGNPVHRSILYSGFWNSSGGYANIFNGDYACFYPLRNAVYVRFVKRINIGGKYD